MSYNATKYSAYIMFVSATIVASMFFLDHIMEIPVCPLCFIQRPSWYLILILLPINLFIKTRIFQYLIISLVSLLLLFTLGYGIYQAGAEWKLWEGLSSCGNLQQNIKDFLLSYLYIDRPLILPDYIPCSTEPWRFLGLSLAGYNAVLSSSQLILCALIFNNIYKNK